MVNILFVTSNHQTTNFDFPNFFHEFFSVKQLKKKTNFWTNKKFVYLSDFSTAKTEKSSWKKLGETRLVVWWFDVTNKILAR